MPSDEPIKISDTNIPVLTDVIRGAATPALGRNTLVAELHLRAHLDAAEPH